ncbi:MAG: hypothetical protein OEV59_05695 [Deltaproteobacteria bacterium]|nr:hypothetical protein [Deltaproteobacteria bacterium]
MATRIQYIDIYASRSDVDINIIEDLLADEDIDFVVRRVAVDDSDFDLEGANEEKILSVEEDRAKNAVKVIEQALSIGAISDDGFFIE